MQSAKSGVSRVLGLPAKLICVPKAYIRYCHVLTVTEGWLKLVPALDEGIFTEPGWTMNKRTPNRHSARSFGFLGRSYSFVQGLLKCSSFVGCTILKGARDAGRLCLSQQSLRVPATRIPSKPLPTPPLCFQIRATNTSFIETRQRRIEISKFYKRTNHTVTLSLSSPCLERLRLALGFVTERSQIHPTPARRSLGAYYHFGSCGPLRIFKVWRCSEKLGGIGILSM
jgi:hypothetical protein